jgi:hypothetical protein
MLSIANTMQRLHLQGDFWKHLAIAVSELVQEKEQSSALILSTCMQPMRIMIWAISPHACFVCVRLVMANTIISIG